MLRSSVSILLNSTKLSENKRETVERDSITENNFSGGAAWHIRINSPISLSALTDTPVAKAGSSPLNEEEPDAKGALVKLTLLLALLDDISALLPFSLPPSRLSPVSNIIEGPNSVLTFMLGLGLGGCWCWFGREWEWEWRGSESGDILNGGSLKGDILSLKGGLLLERELERTIAGAEGFEIGCANGKGVEKGGVVDKGVV